MLRKWMQQFLAFLNSSFIWFGLDSPWHQTMPRMFGLFPEGKCPSFDSRMFGTNRYPWLFQKEPHCEATIVNFLEWNSSELGFSEQLHIFGLFLCHSHTLMPNSNRKKVLLSKIGWGILRIYPYTQFLPPRLQLNIPLIIAFDIYQKQIDSFLVFGKMPSGYRFPSHFPPPHIWHQCQA